MQARDRRADSPEPADQATRPPGDRPECSTAAELGPAAAMAKALLGHVGGPDPGMLSEMRRLRRRVRDLEAELARLQDENDVLAAAARQHAASGRRPDTAPGSR